jgi:nucleoside-diphosphate-sugar epimerase
MDIGKAERLLGWRPRIDFEQGLALTFADGKLT